MTVAFNLRKALKRRMEVRGITAADLSRQTGVAKQVLSDWLAGAMPRSLSQVKIVANALGTTVDDLCFSADGSGNGDAAEDAGGSSAGLDGQWIVGVFEGRIRVVETARVGVRDDEDRIGVGDGDGEGVD